MRPDEAPSLDDLFRAANRGDARAYAAFLREVSPLIRGIVRARASGIGPDQCEDVVQETLLAIHQKRQTWRPELPVRPWLHAIVRYKVIDAFRARGRRIHLPIEEFAELLPAEAAADPTERSDAERVIDRLDPRSAQVIRAIGLEGASVAELSSALAMTEGAIRVVLHRGLKKLARLRRSMIE